MRGQIKAEHTELEELREMKEDIVRRERAQAVIIDNQAKRLEELDLLYKVAALPCAASAAREAEQCSQAPLQPCQALLCSECTAKAPLSCLSG